MDFHWPSKAARRKLGSVTRTVLLLLMIIGPGRLVDAQPAPMILGRQAMDSHLWEIAAHHFEAALARPELDASERLQASLLLAEALIRDARPATALELLEQSAMQAHPDTPFWRAQALAASGRFAQAVELLVPLIETESDSPYRMEAALTVASLELALDRSVEALVSLNLAAGKLKGADLQRVRLRQMAILLDLGRTEEARELMPAQDQIDASLRDQADFIDAGILLREQRHEEAAVRFQKLVENPRQLSLREHHASWVGWSDALLALGNRQQAADLLLDFIQKNPDSSRLEEVFKRLLHAMPAQPTPSDTLLERLALWIEAPDPPASGLVPTGECRAVSAWPHPRPANDLTAFSLYTRAEGLHRMGQPESMREARLLLTRLRLDYPTHFLATRALLTLARWDLESNQTEDARHLLSVLRETATSPLIKGRAAFLEARSIARTAGKPAEAAALYQEAAGLLRGIEADTARFNAALITLIQNDETNPGEADHLPIEDPQLASNLMLERALAIKDPTRQQLAIEEFLLKHPHHDRAPEARVNAAEASLMTSPPDLSSARAQVEALESDPEQHSTIAPARLALVKLRILDLAGETEQAIAAARLMIGDFPASPESVEASFILGTSLFSSGNYNDARLVYEKLAGSVEDTHRSQSALLLAARAAALIPTSQSQQEALALFERCMKIEGPLQSLARIERGRLMIDMGQLAEAQSFLRPWFDTLKTDDPHYLAAGFLLGEAIYAQGNLNPDSLPQALAIYDQLLQATAPHSADYDRIQYLRGLTLEQLPDPEIPDIKREKEALIAYYSVLERQQAPTRWEYLESCGFRALSLLERARRWPAAIACAKKIASFGGPRAQEAAARADQIQLKYMIWED